MNRRSFFASVAGAYLAGLAARLRPAPVPAPLPKLHDELITYMPDDGPFLRFTRAMREQRKRSTCTFDWLEAPTYPRPEVKL